MRGVMKGIVTGALVGATAMAVAGRMNKSTQKKLTHYVARTAHRAADKASQLFR